MSKEVRMHIFYSFLTVLVDGC